MTLGLFFTCSFRQLRLIPNLAPSDICLIGAFLSIMVNHKMRSEIRKNIYLVLSGILFLTYFILDSFLVSSAPLESSINYIKIFFAFVCLPIVIQVFFQIYIDAKVLYGAFVLGSLSAIIFGYIVGNQVVQDRSLGFTGHPVYNGILISLGISIVISNFQALPILKISQFLISGFLLYAFFQSASSTGLLIICTSLFIKLLGYLRERKFFLFSFAIGISAIVGTAIWSSSQFVFTKSRLLLALNPSHGFSISNSSGTSTLEGRKLSITEGWLKIKSNPLFGHGLDVSGTNTSINLQPHNFLVLAWLSGGIILFGLAIVFTIYALCFFIIGFRLGASLEVNVIFGSLIAFMSCPLIYERSILAPLFLALYSIRQRKRESSRDYITLQA
jgi:hypothetical protein